MSDLEEPPAKVLKIDNIDGVTHVTELTGFTEPFDPSVPGEAMLGEESGIIEGGADPEQEEWLSEGILTDDDFNASQGTVEDQTDSQLGTEDEEHLDSTLDSEANLGTNDAQIDDTEPHLTENQAQLHESEEHLTETEAIDNEAQLTSEPQTAETETHLTESETHLNETDAHLPETGEHLDENEASFAQNELSFEVETHLNGNNVNGAHSMTGLVENGEYVLETKANVDTSEMNAESEPSLIQIEINVNPKNTTVNDSNMSINDTNVANDTNATDDTDVTNVTSDTNVTNDTIMAQSIEHLMAMANIDAAMMESQTYTQDLLESDTKESDIVIQRVITVNKNPSVKEIETKAVELNIEETMKHLDGEKDGGKVEEDFEQLLEKTTVAKINKVKAEPKDDGNDTDDLLRMLGEDDSKGKKKLTKTVRDIRAAAGDAASTDDDDDFVYEGTSAKMKNLKHLKAAKNALAKRQPAKAEPEEMEDDDDDTEMSADESKTMQRIFNTTSNSLQQRRTTKAPAAVKRTPAVVNVIERPRDVKPPTRTYQNKRLLQSGASLLKPTIQTRSQPSKPSYSAIERKPPTKSDVKTPVPFKPSIQIAERKKEKIEPPKIKTEPGKIEPSKIKIEPGKTKTEIRRVRFDPASVKVEPARGKVGSRFEPEMKGEPDEMIDEEEFLDDEEFGLDEDEFAESEIDMSHHRQRIMRPEMMDEEVPSDGESVSEDGSLYDELPSSDSEDVDDWFTLDIRSEKAADYIPLLGPKAKELLLEEKRRVAARLSTLKQSHTALISTGKQQAATLRRATATLAELDDMLRAA